MTLSELLPKIGPGRPEPQLSESNDSIDSVDSLGSSAMISSDDPTGIRDVVLGAQAPHPRREIQDLLEHLHQMGITETRQQLTQQIEAACSAPITSSPDKSKAVDQIRSKMTAKRNEYSSFVSKQQSLTQMSLDTAIKKLRELDLREQEAAAKLRAEEEARKKKEEAERQALEEAKRKEQEELTRKKEAEQAAAEAKAKEKELQERQKAEAAAKAVAEAKQKADAEQAKMAGPIVPAQGPHSESSVIATVTAWKMASACLQRTEHVKKVAKPATFADAQAKNKIFMVRMMVTRSVGQVTNSRAKVNEVSKTIDRAFTEARAININALEYILDFTAKQFVLQAEKEVAVKHSMAFPIARVCLLLCKEHPEFVELLMGRLIKRCSYVVPMYYPKLASESSTDWQKRAGFRPTGDGETLETEIQYGERMNGILAFYLALVQLTDVPNPFGVGYLWTWLARILNLKPRRLTPTFLQTFLEIGGYAFMAEYQSQANKIMRYMIEVYIPQIPAQAVAATTRLNITLEDCAKRGSVAKPEGSTMDP
ncbi:GLE1-like protein-domain-containing protein [Polychytrium aggregatum]|uniref:GLE1-like protein-domain-containing protein n=1 Tax=Polychytrium aggregatum TaxID=110093 RepID=UPI0022FDB71E|nr:GLE1-like protein-domain-containing protein [Polychytrium aggregatum]KAI9209725.1 GLE1-like protein-domain-containing protein [Polychytrium aggregatum]